MSKELLGIKSTENKILRLGKNNSKVFCLFENITMDSVSTESTEESTFHVISLFVIITGNNEKLQPILRDFNLSF